MRPMHRNAVVALLCCAGAGTLHGQASDALYTRWAGYTGFQFQSYSISVTPSAKATEWAIPLVMVAPLGDHMSADLTADYANAKVSDGSGDHTLNGLTDTQIRLLYTLNRDRAVVSLSINLPTGKHTLTSDEFRVYTALGTNYLSFPIADFGTAFGATAGVAFATPAGGWNLGASGAIRYTGSYVPLDTTPPTTYKPGIEFRGRLGADRLVGQSSRFLVGLTASTFSNDQLNGGQLGVGSFSPGLRFIGDAGWVSALGNNTLSISVWDFYRAKGDLDSTSENILNAEARFAINTSPRLSVQPLVGVRTWSPGQNGGTFVMGGLAARLGLSDQFSANLEGRYSSGKALQQVGTAQLVSFTGASVQVMLQYQH